jgi:hypothetical protein
MAMGSILSKCKNFKAEQTQLGIVIWETIALAYGDVLDSELFVNLEVKS